MCARRGFQKMPRFASCFPAGGDCKGKPKLVEDKILLFILFINLINKGEGSIYMPQIAIVDVALHPHVPTPLALVSLLERLQGLTAPFSVGQGGTGEGVGLALLAPLQTAAH